MIGSSMKGKASVHFQYGKPIKPFPRAPGRLCNYYCVSPRAAPSNLTPFERKVAAAAASYTSEKFLTKSKRADFMPIIRVER
jgi:hypothetical protein